MDILLNFRVNVLLYKVFSRYKDVPERLYTGFVLRIIPILHGICMGLQRIVFINKSSKLFGLNDYSYTLSEICALFS